ncbi:hypothetical protein [Streptomyces chartreusis]|uniref:hypothetical protein n=1 Tax=Streptomyces chartreusis TaxID=1969 RepID=UPI0033FE6D15
MSKTSGKGEGEVPKRQPANPPTLISNSVRTFFLGRDLSADTRAQIESAEWVEERQCWALTLTPEAADELTGAALSGLDA